MCSLDRLGDGMAHLQFCVLVHVFMSLCFAEDFVDIRSNITLSFITKGTIVCFFFFFSNLVQFNALP